jgi:molecular chaperone DnaJ
MSGEKRDYYEVLGVPRGAPADEVKRAFRSLARRFHPDHNPGNDKAEASFKELNEAYEVLSDPQKRQVYDTYGHAALGGGGPGAAGGFQGFEGFSDVFGDIFSEFFGGGGRRGGRRGRGSDLECQLEIEFEEAAFGVEKMVHLPRVEPCPDCKGAGARDASGVKTCPACRGRGQVSVSQGFFSITRTCAGCQGAGRTIVDPCNRCRGRGRVEMSRSLKVQVPAGVQTGNRLKLRGEGEPAMPGGTSGDLYVVLVVREHSKFTRDGDDVVLEQPISFPIAALGGEITVPTLRGEETIKIPAATQTGHVFKIRGAGIESIHGGRTGDELVHVRIVVPKHLSKRQRELLVEFAREGGDTVDQEKGFFERIKEVFSSDA